MDWAIPSGTGLWQAALAAIPLVIFCAVFCRLLPLRAATRHTLWVATLAAFVLPLILPSAPNVSLPDWNRNLVVIDSESPPIAAAPVESELPSALESPGTEPIAKHMNAEPAVALTPTPDSSSSLLTVPVPTASTARLHIKPDSTEQPGLKPRPATAAVPAKDVAKRAVGGRTSPIATEKHAAPPAAPMAPITASAGPLPPAGPAAGIATEGVQDAWLLAWRATIGTWFFAWVEALRWSRDALVRLPALPSELWVCGIALLVLTQSLRIAAFCRRMRRADPAPAAVVKSVTDVAAALGLRRIPRTLLIDERISPLIWCGRKPTLILPLGLWMQLDRNGRRAILAHELAHLQRLDHWVCWLEQAVTLLYWWHPLVWWIRRRIHEEADLSCDAWVTWLMPQGRRAYAEALLRTKQFVSANGADVPAGGMAAASGRAREFARRLTMVMTYTARPRRSMTGIALAGTLAAAGWIATPAWSCPPGQEEKGQHYSATKAAAPHVVVGTSGNPLTVATPAASGTTVKSEDSAPIIWRSGGMTTVPGSNNAYDVMINDGKTYTIPGGAFSGSIPSSNLGTTFTTTPIVVSPFSGSLGGAYVLAQAHNGDEDQEKLAKLEAELHRLAEQLAELRHGQSGGTHAHTGPEAGPTPPMAPAQPGQPSAPRSAMRAPVAIAQGGAEVVRAYELPGGKIEALYALMVRDDVPIRVARDGNKISVHGTEGQQEIFRQFVEMINPGAQRRTPAPAGMGGGRSGGGPGGGVNRAPQGLMPAQPGTPRGSGSRRSMRAPGNEDAQRRLSDALLQLKEIEGNPQDAAKEILAKAELWQAAAKAGSKEAREKVSRVADKLRSLAEMRQVEIEKYAQQAAQLGEQASTFGEQAQQMLEQAAKLAAEKSEAGMRERANSLEKAAKDLEMKARELEKEAAKWEKKANQAEKEADKVTDQADELNGMIESFDEDSSDANDEDDAAPDAEEVTQSITTPAPVAGVACSAEVAAVKCDAAPTPTPAADATPVPSVAPAATKSNGKTGAATPAPARKDLR